MTAHRFPVTGSSRLFPSKTRPETPSAVLGCVFDPWFWIKSTLYGAWLEISKLPFDATQNIYFNPAVASAVGWILIQTIDLTAWPAPYRPLFFYFNWIWSLNSNLNCVQYVKRRLKFVKGRGEKKWWSVIGCRVWKPFENQICFIIFFEYVIVWDEPCVFYMVSRGKYITLNVWGLLKNLLALPRAIHRFPISTGYVEISKIYTPLYINHFFLYRPCFEHARALRCTPYIVCRVERIKTLHPVNVAFYSCFLLPADQPCALIYRERGKSNFESDTRYRTFTGRLLWKIDV